VILTPNASSKFGAASNKGESSGNNTMPDGENNAEEEGAEAGEGKKFGKDEEILLDAQTIFKYNIIKKKNP
jgi:hypothetical protein